MANEALPAGDGPESRDAFLGTQGDVWDAQAFALLGATHGLVLLKRVHQRSMDALTSRAR